MLVVSLHLLLMVVVWLVFSLCFVLLRFVAYDSLIFVCLVFVPFCAGSPSLVYCTGVVLCCMALIWAFVCCMALIWAVCVVPGAVTSCAGSP